MTHPRPEGAQSEDALRSFEDLQGLLRRDGVRFQSDEPGGRVSLPTAIEGDETAMLVVWDPRRPFLHVTLALPFEVPAARLPVFERVLLGLNHGMLLPGFGLNHATRTVYYRISVPRRLDGSLAGGEVRGLVNVAATTARHHYRRLRELLEGGDGGGVLAGSREPEGASR
jgi:hypothetical protein